MHSDHQAYLKLTGRSRLDKSVNSLLGIVEGIAVDASINSRELAFLQAWLDEHADLRDSHPYNELMPVVHAALADGVLTQEEREEITWLSEKLKSDGYYNTATADMQRLHAMLGGIASDRLISEAELRGLHGWLVDHEHLKTCWPYDEVDSLIVHVLRDKKIDEQEHAALIRFFSEFVSVLDDKTVGNPTIQIAESIVGLCSVCPEIIFTDSAFCLTGASNKYTRSEFSKVIRELGGRVVPSIIKDLNYLIIGADGNPCWAYACYGRKVEKAVELRKAGARLMLIHENDFHDAITDRL